MVSLVVSFMNFLPLLQTFFPILQTNLTLPNGVLHLHQLLFTPPLFRLEKFENRSVSVFFLLQPMITINVTFTTSQMNVNFYYYIKNENERRIDDFLKPTLSLL